MILPKLRNEYGLKNKSRQQLKTIFTNLLHLNPPLYLLQGTKNAYQKKPLSDPRPVVFDITDGLLHKSHTISLRRVAPCTDSFECVKSKKKLQ